MRDLPRHLEGRTRPSHFSGVTVIVCKLFNIFQATRAYFGQKDAQQCVIIGRMIEDLNINTELVICPIVRDANGLALSSRNLYLSAEERLAAPVLNVALSRAVEAVETGTRDSSQLRAIIRETIEMEPLANIDYISVADATTLREVSQVKGKTLLSLAVYFGKTRLIDNRLIQI